MQPYLYMKNAENYNDRKNLVLLKYWKNKPRKWIKVYDSLCKRYVDNKHYESRIIDELKYIELMDVSNSELIRDELGRPEYKYPDLPKELYTTDKGIEALRNKAYPSEMEHEKSEKRFVMFQIVGILIAAIGGIITIITAILD